MPLRHHRKCRKGRLHGPGIYNFAMDYQDVTSAVRYTVSPRFLTTPFVCPSWSTLSILAAEAATRSSNLIEHDDATFVLDRFAWPPFLGDKRAARFVFATTFRHSRTSIQFRKILPTNPLFQREN